MEIVLLLGAKPYPLPERSARFLLEWIRSFAGDGVGLDEAGTALVRLADVVEEDLAGGKSPEPIELGWRHVEGLLAYVLRDYLVDGDDALTRLYVACRRFRGDPPSSYFAKRGFV